MCVCECICVDMVLFTCHKVSDVHNFTKNSYYTKLFSYTIAPTSHKIQGTFQCVYIVSPLTAQGPVGTVVSLL
jgi:hypothetical protein